MAGVLNTKNKRKITKRGRGGKSENCLVIFSTNAAGLKNKIQSFKNEIKHTNAAIFTIQETHYQNKGKFKFDGFEIFESIIRRKHGGTLMGVHSALQPILIEEYYSDFEMLVVEIKVSGKEIRMIMGYGPQENSSDYENIIFYQTKELEINNAENLGKSIIIAMDFNAKLGPYINKGDPNVQSPNGKKY